MKKYSFLVIILLLFRICLTIFLNFSTSFVFKSKSTAKPLPNLRSGVLFSRREGTPDRITLLLVCRPLISICERECRRCHLRIRMNQAQLPEVASWARMTQGTNSVNLRAVLYSTADKYMVYFLKHVLLFRS